MYLHTVKDILDEESKEEKSEMTSNCGQYYSGRIANDEHKAVEILDRFTKEFCIDAAASEDLEFRCKECPFEDGDKCRVKMFKCKYAPNYEDFGAMGDL